MKERAKISEILQEFDEMQRLNSSILETEELIRETKDEELRELAEQEILELKSSMLLPKNGSRLFLHREILWPTNRS